MTLTGVLTVPPLASVSGVVQLPIWQEPLTLTAPAKAVFTKETERTIVNKAAPRNDLIMDRIIP